MSTARRRRPARRSPLDLRQIREYIAVLLTDAQTRIAFDADYLKQDRHVLLGRISTALMALRGACAADALIPRCEVCRAEPAISFSWFPDREKEIEKESGTWKFTGACTTNTEEYYITFDRFRTEAQRDDWDRHLSGKTWFNRSDWAYMLGRFVEAGGVVPRW